MRTLTAMGLLSAGMLLFQVALTRVFAIAQFYHFAFLVISLALLGFGASGSLLALWPRLHHPALSPVYALGFAASTILAYLFLNHTPFDSYAIAWDSSQLWLLAGNLLGLAVPFVMGGLLISALLSRSAATAGRIYAANLFGSAGGAILAPLLIDGLGSERAVLLCAVLGTGAALMLVPDSASGGGRRRIWVSMALVGLVLSLALLAVLPAAFAINPSPYKRLSYFRLDPDAVIIATRQNAYTRLDVVDSPTIHSAQGLSLAYVGPLPRQSGLLIDGDTLYPVADAGQASAELAGALPAALAYELRPDGSALLLGSGGSMDAWAALANGARSLTVVEPNALVYDALAGDLRALAGLDDPRLRLVHDEIRTFSQVQDRTYDIVQLALTDNYRPITSGAFTLTENYTLTVEAFRSYLALCGEDGLLVFTRWLQNPPSESLRAMGIVIEALRAFHGADPDILAHVFVYRSFQTITFIVRPTPFTPDEIDRLLDGISALRYDLVLAPEMPADAINRFARLESPLYHDLFLRLATTPDRAGFYAAYDFDLTPPTDDHPFFFHFFRWQQTPDVLQNLGQRWQPFGGSGYFVLLALLTFVLLAALAFVLLPIGLKRRFRQTLAAVGGRQAGRVLVYFATLGLAYLLVEVALIQRYILALGQPTLAMATVVGTLLLWSGLGSALSHRISWRWALLTLVPVLVAYPLVTGVLTPLLLTLPPVARIGAVALLIGPAGLLMGVPFARGIAALSPRPGLVPWAWAINGSASVISAVLAPVLSLSYGFTVVMLVGGGLYLLAALTAAPISLEQP